MSLPLVTLGGQVEVDDVPLGVCPAWWILDLIVCWQMPAITLVNRRQRGTTGTKPYTPLLGESRFTWNFYVKGDCDVDGTPFDDDLVGLESNIDYLHANVFLPLADGVRTATLTKPSGAQFTGPIQFETFPMKGDGGATLTTTLGVCLPQGWTAVP